jgi:hypothetical protein
VLLRAFLIGTATYIVLAAQVSGQSQESPWSMSLITLFAPILLLIIIWLVIWRRIGFGKGGYRKFIVENQERMAQIEKHLAEISQQLERIATSLERSGR